MERKRWIGELDRAEVPVSPFTIAFLVLFLFSIPIALGLIACLRRPLLELLQNVVILPAGTEYFSRVFVVVVVLTVLGAIADPPFNLKDSVHLIEYVWAVAHGLKSVFENLVISVFVYTGLITVLLAALRGKQ
jgi:hypothetical protein